MAHYHNNHDNYDQFPVFPLGILSDSSSLIYRFIHEKTEKIKDFLPFF